MHLHLLDMRCGSNSDLECSLLVPAPPANGLWQTLDLPWKVTARSGVVWDDAMHVDGVGADRLHGPLLGLVNIEDMLLAGFILSLLRNIVSLKTGLVDIHSYF